MGEVGTAAAGEGLLFLAGCHDKPLLEKNFGHEADGPLEEAAAGGFSHGTMVTQSGTFRTIPT